MSDTEHAKAEAEVAVTRLNAIGIAVRAGALTSSPELEAEVRSLLSLPAMPASVRDAWTRDGNVRLPITLAQGDAAPAGNAGTPANENPP